jgi:hypothetical protein
MPSQSDVQALIDQITPTVGVLNSAKVYVEGVPALVQAAVDAALAANPGVDLSGLTTLASDLTAGSNAVLAAMAANSPPA